VAAVTTLLIGHRGVGKTAFLKHVRSQHKNCICLDLDQEMEVTTGVSIAQLWSGGEATFRELERVTLNSLLARSGEQKVIALGAGFEGPLPENVFVLWIRRETDGDGRVFLNRPRLNPELSPYDEYMQRFAIRDQRFRQWADEQLILPEGYDERSAHSPALADFVLNPSVFKTPFDFTLKPEHFRRWPEFLSRRSEWQVRHFELREDLLSREQIQMAQQSIAQEHLIYTARTTRTLPDRGACDWALELGEPPRKVKILSLHERHADLRRTIETFSTHSAGVLKLSVEIDNFSELELGHNWWQQDPGKRAFLPRSTKGRWRWYRSLFGPRMPVHFIREDEGSAADQPLFWQTQLQPPFKNRFAAVLGSPVHHSRSPLEHLSFFRERDMPFVAIDINEEEFAQGFPVLQKFGLTHAAVTSPLKKVAHKICNSLTDEARVLESVNTLKVEKNGEVHGHNTDVLALQVIKEELSPGGEVWLWGGGGVRSSIKAVWPQAREISARQGSDEAGRPDLLVWATGRSNRFQWPGPNLQPQQVFDLNYSANSPGLEWAALRNLPYQSGLRMFKLQAGFQQQFWQTKGIT